ncbi:hypothetical protein FT663_03296 [Candidozyma haemuli var. vulneris]|uniref:Uncharacterized protein n=1 Tax=Candidozyma haemuli TaxID=45357 RepID=A0A2V1ASY0_9ASCO|nr:hypothetical protein CXQ85_000280 [[Candida] haemuloni]KAF3988444.1 hypothetical protein FT662_03393 [[Candida] haemuloni var. vulneris]KAF3990147.1 hypothetical protein FT663_03296 [[Candida] haemuloni var. vulneris]PVH21307.1 hypothetical protein CXQ85_000280 [[Candida] haemuloni]
MAFNPAYETRRRVSVRHTVPEETESAVLSESQSSWVVFNPDRVDNDVISFSTTNPLTTEGSGEAVSDNESEASHESEETDNDELIDEVQPSLSSRIDQWQNATDAAAVSDNIASWDLDSDLVTKLLDTSILRRVPAYYGDTYFENMSKAEYMRFKRASAILRKSLTKKGAPVDKDLITRLLQVLQWQNLLSTSGTLVNDYIINTLARTQPSVGFRDVEYSDTATSSSMVMCGGGSSWNDI